MAKIVAQNPKHLPGSDIILPTIAGLGIEKSRPIILPHYPDREQEPQRVGPGQYIDPSEAVHILTKA